MELTKKDKIIYDFIITFKICKQEHIEAFSGIQNVNKRLNNLVWQNLITITEDIIRTKETESLSIEEQKNMLKVLDVATKLKTEEKIKDIHIIDLPYYIMSKSTKKDTYVYFTIVNKGHETIQLSLIDKENKGNTILILEDNTQVKYLNILKTKVNKLIIYDEYIK